MNEIIFKDLIIEHIQKPSLKNSYISVKAPFNVILKTPKVSKTYINKLLLEKELWIRKRLLNLKKNPPIKINLEDELLLFGEVYSIDTEEAYELRKLLEKMKNTTQKNALTCYDKFYKLYSNKYITSRLNYFCDIMNLSYKEVKFRKMRSRWGSCSSLGIVTFNSELVKLKKEFIDYVVVHELAHLVHMNHSRSFHNLVDKYIVNSKIIRKELKGVNLNTIYTQKFSLSNHKLNTHISSFKNTLLPVL